MSEQILLPYDGSTPSEKALEYALETFPDADLTALYVVPAPRGYWGAFEEAEDRIPNAEKAKERGHELLDDAEAMAADQDRDLETELIVGEPEHVIVGQASDGEYDTIVIGSHGREGVSRVLLGSVAEKVVRRSPTPVVVVR
ncbi:UspA domain protein (plasmid) [Natrialba magadii ATCC 43099]|uniref:UspA domain protein n=1 Tax=Natrialba magadii (strain ATCC 43099 / DSM 3394 / CCM 3739 / CIP 104546 / IAM 13178 / JCM 8861 / NBRC 102185 / NCIMB 2190 / MS3) TaxID=547559 RepID=D3T0T2_NATMM|nr:universal stress protein [Natrialba magadii]ADD07191.1 UspA domain protein [Natrialba magadii ATCC 43099]ELY34305.1 UspA domain-containing protein [Natrialba magadii ATCC 43099]